MKLYILNNKIFIYKTSFQSYIEKMISIQGVIAICLVAFILNLPFGWLRVNTRKFSLGWLFCVHAPIPVVALIRISTNTPWTFIPLFLLFSVAGQIGGAWLKKVFAKAS